MTTSSSQLREGCIVVGSLFNEPMRVETVRAGGDGTWTVGAVGTRSEWFRKVMLTTSDINSLTILYSDFSYEGTAASYDRVCSGRAVARPRRKTKTGSR